MQCLYTLWGAGEPAPIGATAPELMDIVDPALGGHLAYISHFIYSVKILCGVLFEHALSVLDLNYVIILPNAGAISTSAEFL